MPLYIVGIAIAIGFALLLWRQHKSGVGWQREVSFVVDLVALSATALVVGVLVVAQLGPSDGDTQKTSQDEENTPIAISTKAIENEPVVATETVVIAESEPEPVVATETIDLAESEPIVATERVASATSVPKLTVTMVDEEAEATATKTPTKKPDPTIEAKITATSTLIPKPTVEPTPDVTTYIVRSGDVFGLIAQNNSLSFEELQTANPSVVPEGIKIGDELIIPPVVEDEEEEESEEKSSSEDTTPTPMVDPNQYFVRDGDTFSTIAEQFELTTKELSEYNPDTDPNRISVGDKIYVP